MTYEEFITKYEKLIKGIAFKYKLKTDYEDRVQEAYLELYKNYEKIKDKSEGEQVSYINTALNMLFNNIYLKEHKQLLYVTDSINKNVDDEEFDLLDRLDEKTINNDNKIQDEYLQRKIEKQREWSKNYYHNNKEKCRQKARENNDKKVAYNRELRQRKRELFDSLSKDAQDKILEEFGTRANFVAGIHKKTLSEYKEKNKERIREQQKIYSKRYWEKNKSKNEEQLKEYRKEYRQTEKYKEYNRNYQREYRKKNKTQRISISKQEYEEFLKWKQNNT